MRALLAALLVACSTPPVDDRQPYLAAIGGAPERCAEIRDVALRADCASYAMRFLPADETRDWCASIPVTIWRESCFFERAQSTGQGDILASCAETGSLARACAAARTRSAIRALVQASAIGGEAELRAALIDYYQDLGQTQERAHRAASVTVAHAVAHRIREASFDADTCGSATLEECSWAYWLTLQTAPTRTVAPLCSEPPTPQLARSLGIRPWRPPAHESGPAAWRWICAHLSSRALDPTQPPFGSMPLGWVPPPPPPWHPTGTTTTTRRRVDSP